ncbi:rod shape-determining protein MreC [Salicibibacter halophilus]|uniref:Cell shape-determining protein MreC n=1 Tax=Salicibibacter halophilus TaxID=2502791 RepID=A0A514LIB9_9BACI|nr:rod shape-determining protein MreC [Salicibibacter halophilus]QDI91031.1 rod shape-determining protein MreC [Salicibibacter halophilus]
MPHFFSNKRLILLMVSIIVLVILVGLTMNEREEVTWPEQFINDSVGVVQSAFQRPANFLGGIFDDIGNIANIYEENERLKSQMDDYAFLSSEVDGLREENASLREAQDMEESLGDYSSLTALVIERQPDRWTETIGINRGSQHGIENDMAVITAGGLVGRIQHTGMFTSQVQLLSDGERMNRISAKVAIEDEAPAYGFIEGWDDEEGAFVLSKIEAEEELEEGQEVSTSGLGGLGFPADLPIGKITGVESDEYGLTMNAFVEPAADYHNIEHVMVLDRNSPELEDFDEEEEEEETEGAEEPVELDPEGGAD